MPTSDLSLFQAMKTKMDWLEQRQKVIAQNIANADTPNYRPKDLAPLKFKDVLKNSTSDSSMGVYRDNNARIAKTNTEHLSLDAGETGRSRQMKTRKDRQTYEVAPAGNSVVIEEQLIKANEVAADHRLMTNLYQKQISMMRTALGKN